MEKTDRESDDVDFEKASGGIFGDWRFGIYLCIIMALNLILLLGVLGWVGGVEKLTNLLAKRI